MFVHGFIRSWLVTALAALIAAGAFASPTWAGSDAARPQRLDSCTIATPGREATIVVQIAHADDFCELVSQGLADEVFRSAVVVMPSAQLTYAGARLSCVLRFKATPFRLSVWNAPDACRWFTRSGTGWHGIASSL